MADFSNLPDFPEAGLPATLLWQVFGPPAGVIGEKLKTTDESFRLSNLGRIVQVAANKLGPRLDDEGSVPLRVIAETWERGTYSDDEVVAEYFGGILASSRSPDGRDDRGACWAGLLGRLATDDVRLHYLLYERWRALLLPHHEPPFQPNLAEAGVRKGLCKMYIPVPELAAALDLDSDPAPPPGRDQDVWFAIVFAMGALKREGLIDAWSANDIVLDLQMYAPEADQPGHIVCPSVHGLHLFFRAHGYPYWNLSNIHSPEVKLETVTHLPTLGDGTRLIADMKRDPAITFREDPFS